jgi:broad specificity phosphatase PhoE
MKVYFAAHATSKDNEAGIFSGWKNVELSEP